MSFVTNQETSQNQFNKEVKMFAFQLCTFISQSKHQKVQKMLQINQPFISKFIHLFEICNINRYIDYTEEFIKQIRNSVLRLQVVQKKRFQYLDYKEDYVYLIIQGGVQKCKKPKNYENNKRISKLNRSGFSFNSSQVSSFCNTRASSQNQNSFHLREIQKQILTNRHSRMSFLSNISQAIVPKKKKKLFSNTSPTNFYLINEEDQSNSSIQQDKTRDIKLIEPQDYECFQAKSHVKAIKLLKWSYDQLVQFVFKYQNDRLVTFLSERLNITQIQIRNNQIHNKSNYVYFKERKSGHTNQKIQLNPTSLYLLRKGTLQFRYLQEQKCEKNSQKNINFADYHNKTQEIYKKIILNQGARIFLNLQKSPKVIIQALEDIVLVEINKKLLEYISFQIPAFQKNLKQTYTSYINERSQYMKDQQDKIKSKQKQIHLQNVCLRSKNKPSKRFRTSNNIDAFDQRQQILSGANSQDYQEFISVIPYEIMVKSKEKISAKLNSKKSQPIIQTKVFSYLKKVQQKKHKSKQKMMELKLKNMAQKSINLGQLKSLQKSIKRKSKNKLQETLKANWFNEVKNLSQTPEKDSPKSPPLESKVIQSPTKKQNNIINILTHRKDNHQSQCNNLRQNPIQSANINSINTLKRPFTAAFQAQSIPTHTQTEQQQFFSKDDTGLINKFVKYSHNYQKQISFLLNSNQKQNRVKTCKTEGNVFSHNILKNLLKKYNKDDSYSRVQDSKQNKVYEMTNESVESTQKIESVMKMVNKVKSYSRKRPQTASTAKNLKTQCRSTLYNRYIETQTRDYQRKLTQVQGTNCSQSSKSQYNYKPTTFNSVNNKKIFSQLQNGKIVKKSVKQANWNSRKFLA